ncbi:MAG TPA: hypothetical protein VMU88_05165 [bacterium]|nr:hypothetical protein [bacterium]
MKFDKSWIRWVLMKLMGLVLALVFLALAALALGYPGLSALANLQGTDAKITAVKPACPTHPLVRPQWGFYALDVSAPPKQKFEKLYVMYPQWPGHWAPQKGDAVKVWPADHPRFAAVATDGWGWLILGSIFIFGLLMLEFFFLSFSLR